MPKKKLPTTDTKGTGVENKAMSSADNVKRDNRGKSPESKKALEKSRSQRKEKALEEKKMMQLNIIEHEDFLYRMAKYYELTVTKYLLNLIKEDEVRNASIYEKLKELPKYDKPERVSPMRGKKYMRSPKRDGSEE